MRVWLGVSSTVGGLWGKKQNILGCCGEGQNSVHEAPSL